jgi:hypothetical protein
MHWRSGDGGKSAPSASRHVREGYRGVGFDPRLVVRLVVDDDGAVVVRERCVPGVVEDGVFGPVGQGGRFDAVVRRFAFIVGF